MTGPIAHIRHRRWLLVLAPLVLYAAALNPYFSPSTYDNVVYYSGAVSIAEQGSFALGGKHIVDWPPGPSALIALPFALGWQSVWAAKVVIVACAAFALLAALRLFEREGRPFPVLTIALFALLPLGFMTGTRILSEWPYVLASMLFLLALYRLRDARSGLIAGIGVGVLLGVASLTKFTGVLLGAAVVAQAIDRRRRARGRGAWRAMVPEVTTAIVGASIFLLWKANLHRHVQAGTAMEYQYYRSGWAPEHLDELSPWTVPAKITDLLFHSDSALRAIGWEGWSAALAAAVPGLVVLTGMVVRLRSKDRAPSDWYVLSLLVLFSAAGSNQQTRYLMPIAPFLIGYGWTGARFIAARLRLPSWRTATISLRHAFAATWSVLLVGGALQMLAIGNLSGTHGGLSVLASPTAESFYRGFWRDLHRACEHIRRAPTQGPIAVTVGGVDKYVTAFTGRDGVEFDPEQDVAFVLVPRDEDITPEQLSNAGLRCVQRHDSLLLYERMEQPRRHAEAHEKR